LAAESVAGVVDSTERAGERGWFWPSIFPQRSKTVAFPALRVLRRFETGVICLAMAGAEPPRQTALPSKDRL
jgi:hypothetical protein